MFCPEGSPLPITVKAGFLSVCEGTVDCRSFVIVDHQYVPPVDVRNKQAPCEKGHYCTGGVSRPCPAGAYGDTTRLSASHCSGFCNRGYYCPEGSSSPAEKACPEGTYGSTVGLKNSSCSGKCLPGYDCKEGMYSATEAGKETGILWVKLLLLCAQLVKPLLVEFLLFFCSVLCVASIDKYGQRISVHA